METILVFSGLGLLAVLGTLTTITTPLGMVELGVATLAAGLLAGIPSGLWYHVVLYRTIAKKTTIPKQWWIAPSRLHAALTPLESSAIRPWFLLGASGVLLCCVGGPLALAGLLWSHPVG